MSFGLDRGPRLKVKMVGTTVTLVTRVNTRLVIVAVASLNTTPLPPLMHEVHATTALKLTEREKKVRLRVVVTVPLLTPEKLGPKGQLRFVRVFGRAMVHTVTVRITMKSRGTTIPSNPLTLFPTLNVMTIVAVRRKIARYTSGS